MVLPAGDPAVLERAFDAQLAPRRRRRHHRRRAAPRQNLEAAAFWAGIATIDGKARRLGEFEVMQGDWQMLFAAAGLRAVTREQVDDRARSCCRRGIARSACWCRSSRTTDAATTATVKAATPAAGRRRHDARRTPTTVRAGRSVGAAQHGARRGDLAGVVATGRDGASNRDARHALVASVVAGAATPPPAVTGATAAAAAASPALRMPDYRRVVLPRRRVADDAVA